MSRIRKPRSRGIGGTYIHITDVPSRISTSETRNYLEKNVGEWAKKYLGKSAEVIVIVEDGSIKAKLIYGGLTLVNIVAIYGGLRDGIDHVVNDASDLSTVVIERFLEHVALSRDDVYRLEKRLGVPGKIQRFLKSMDRLGSQDISGNDRNTLIEDLKDEFLAILVLLDDPHDQELFRHNVVDDIINPPGLPTPDPIRGAFTLDMGPPSRHKRKKRK